MNDKHEANRRLRPPAAVSDLNPKQRAGEYKDIQKGTRNRTVRVHREHKHRTISGAVDGNICLAAEDAS